MMKRLHRKLWIGVGFVFLIAASMWFAAPTFASVTQTQHNTASLTANGVYTTGTLIILKKDAITHQIINEPGVAFDISPNPYTFVPGSTLTVVDNVVVNANYDAAPSDNGIIELLNVIAGTYNITEVAAPAGYLVNPTPITVTVYTDQIATVVSNDYRIPIGKLVIEKRDISNDTIIDLPGATFNLSPNPYNPVPGSTLTVVDNVVAPSGNYDTNPDHGYIGLQNVPMGKYTITEVAAPAGYFIDLTSISVEVPAHGTATVVFNDHPINFVPASSNTGMWVMISVFATLIAGLIWWRGRRSGFSFSGRRDS